MLDGLAGPAIRPWRGIAAGSPFAPYELALMMIPIVHGVRGLRIPIQLSIHVDDIMLAAQGSTVAEVTHHLVAGGHCDSCGGSRAGP